MFFLNLSVFYIISVNFCVFSVNTGQTFFPIEYNLIFWRNVLAKGFLAFGTTSFHTKFYDFCAKLPISAVVFVSLVNCHNTYQSNSKKFYKMWNVFNSYAFKGCDTILLQNLVVFNFCPLFVVIFCCRMPNIWRAKVSVANYSYIIEPYS